MRWRRPRSITTSTVVFEQGFEVEQQTAQIEQRPAWFQVHQEIDIGAVITLAAGYRANNADIMRAAHRGDPQDIVLPMCA